MHFLFSNNPHKNGYGIFAGKTNGKWHITFSGCAEFYHDVVDGRPVSHAFQKEAEVLNAELRRMYEKAVKKAYTSYRENKIDVLRPEYDNQCSIINYQYLS